MQDGVRTGAAYIRVSTDDQLELSPESQLAEIQSYCAKENIVLPEELIFIERDGKSGRKSKNRDAFQAMIAVARQKPRPFDVLLLWEFSRFARNQDESTFYKSILRKKLGIDVISVKEPIPQGMYGRLIEMIIEWQDEFYSVNLSAEVSRSMRLKASRGQYNGRVPLGYCKPPGAVPVIIPEEAHIVRTIFTLYTAGYDKNYIIRYLNDSGFRTRTGKKFDADGVNYILENPFYIGKIRWNRRQSSGTSKYRNESEWIIADSFHEPIIDADTWQRAQERIRQSRLTHLAYAHPVSHGRHWLSGMVKCSVCGKSLSFKAGSKNHSGGFQCLGYRRGEHAGSQYISEKKLTSAVLESLHGVLKDTGPRDFTLISSPSPDMQSKKAIYENELKQLENKYRRLRDAYLNGVDSLEDYKESRGGLDRRREELQQLLEKASAPEAAPEADCSRLPRRVHSVTEILESGVSHELKGEALRSIVHHITFTKAEDTLEFHYQIL